MSIWVRQLDETRTPDFGEHPSVASECAYNTVSMDHEKGRDTVQSARASVELCHFPNAFKIARIVFLGKPGKKDLPQANAYRPIALLPCIGKGLERLHAKVLSQFSRD